MTKRNPAIVVDGQAVENRAVEGEAEAYVKSGASSGSATFWNCGIDKPLIVAAVGAQQDSPGYRGVGSLSCAEGILQGLSHKAAAQSEDQEQAQEPGFSHYRSSCEEIL